MPSICITFPLLLIGAALLLERNMFLKLLFQILQLLGRSVFEFVNSFRVSLFNFMRKPESLGQVKTNNADDHDHQQHFPEPLEITNQPHHRAAEKIPCAGKYEYP